MYGVGLPPSSDIPPEAALPFEPVQPSQQRLATQASPQTSGFTSGESTIHEVLAPLLARRALLLHDLMTNLLSLHYQKRTYLE